MRGGPADQFVLAHGVESRGAEAGRVDGVVELRVHVHEVVVEHFERVFLIAVFNLLERVLKRFGGIVQGGLQPFEFNVHVVLFFLFNMRPHGGRTKGNCKSPQWVRQSP